MDLRRSVNTRIWADEWFEGLTRDEKLLWLYLLTNQYTNMLGIYEVSMSRISFETGITRETLSKAFERFQREGKAFYICNRFVFLVNWLKNQSMNTNMEKNARTSLKNLPDDVLSALSTMHMESFESLSKGLLMLPEIESESEIENEIEKPQRKRFTPPTLDEVREIMKDELESQKFIAYYETVDWTVGKKQMKNWKSAIAGWKLRNNTQSNEPTHTTPKYHKEFT
jgi:hypothetical protein